MRALPTAEPALELGEPLLEGLEALADLAGGLLAAARELGTCLLAAARELVAGIAPAAHHLVDQLGGTIAAFRGRARRGAHRALDGDPHGVGDAPVGWPPSAALAVCGSLVHVCSEHNPRPMSIHLRPTAPIAADVLLPADPATAMALAQRLLAKPLMSNHSHGLWGYSGALADGRELTVQATGIGGPSAALVVAELADHGARRAIRLGTCRALDPGLAPGDLVVVEAVLPGDGTSAALGTRPLPDPALAAALANMLGAAVPAVTVAATDLFHDPARAERDAAGRGAGASVADLETAAVLACARRLGMPGACGLVVAESTAGARDEPGSERAMGLLGEAAARALGWLGEPPPQASESETASLL